MILPLLSYAIAAWGGTFDKATKRIKVQQKKDHTNHNKGKSNETH
jgi:hypothetical protein